MKKEKIITILVILSCLFGFGVYSYLSNNNTKKLCIYEIPNHLKLTCPNGNETRTINYFETTIFEYNNAIENGCDFLEKFNDSGFRYEIAKCEELIPFEVIN